MSRTATPLFFLASLLTVALMVPTFCRAESTAHDKADQRVGDPYPLNVDPVTDADLSKVDKPFILNYHGRELNFANKTNAKSFKANPEKYLLKVDKLIIAQQLPQYPLNTCVVTDEKLGGDMGKPLDRVIGNRLVRFCCPDCVGAFKMHPDKYYKKLDAAVIEEQKADYPLDTCVVSGEKLGGDMGKPIDYVIGDRLVRFCCPSCVSAFQKNPAKYLAKLDAAAKHTEDAAAPQKQ